MDLTRSLAIGSVVLLHVADEYLSRMSLTGLQWVLYQCFRIIGRLGVPLFLMLSGALILSSISKTPIVTFYKKRLPQFILLTAFYFFITNAFCIYLFDLQFDIKDYLYSLVTFKPTFAYQLWYMYIIIILYILSPFMARLVEALSTHSILIIYIVFCLAIFAPISMGRFGFHALWNQYVPYMAYFLFGYLIFNRGIVKKISTAPLVCVFLISYAVTLCTQIYLKENNSFHGEGVTWYTSPFILFTSLTLFSLLSKLTTNERTCNLIELVSLNSFGIYLIHLVPMFFMLKVMSGVNINVIAKITIISLVVFSFSFTYSYLLSKIPLIKKLVV
ncbi:hypothetical protein BMF90_07630 [Serratia sp. OLHL2]|nr:hypothetical protein BMF90_07630 [Serratia sp. OLHL2]PII69993.1 hypothetical protein BMH24_23370 [Serratia sp. OLJL1]PIJ17084.1 hypothetical protein BVV03_22385 [Serratia sp. OSPLW9]PIJ35993.1 hypothetical protein BOM26_08220 [Serratia sp. OPWLW3]PIJ67497.1 hypothetical protein BK415_24685 [Serratia sp. OLMTLW26]PIJ71552.1 hypothetical protein BKC13_06550 [Serratia sp. OLLOLW30]